MSSGDINAFVKRIQAILESVGVPRVYPPTPDTGFVAQFSWLLLGFFAHKTRVRAFLREDVAKAVAPIVTRHLMTPAGTFARPSVELSPSISVLLSRIDALWAVRIDGFHSLIWDCIRAAAEAAAAAVGAADTGAATLARVVAFLEDPKPPAPLCWGPSMRRAGPRGYVLDSAFGPVHIGGPPSALQLSALADVPPPRVFVLPNNMFSGSVDNGEENFGALFGAMTTHGALGPDNRLVIVGTVPQLECALHEIRESVFGPSDDAGGAALAEDIVPELRQGGYAINLPAERSALLGPLAETTIPSCASFCPLDSSGTAVIKLRRRSAASASSSKDETASDESGEEEKKKRPIAGEDADVEGPPPAKASQSEGELKIVNITGLLQIFEDGQLKGVLDGDFNLLQRSSAKPMMLPPPPPPVMGATTSSSSSSSDEYSSATVFSPALPLPPEQFSFQPPAFGITFLGTSNARDPLGRPTGFVIWVNGSGIVVDPPENAYQYMAQIGIRGLVTKAILTHCHTAHDAGITRLLLTGEKMTLYTTRTIHDSYRRKTSSIGKGLHGYYTFVPVRVGEPASICGATFDFDYSFHTIPTIGFQVRYRSRSISYSSDTRYDPELFPELVHKKVMSSSREAALRMRGFDADIVIHELGQAPIHTEARVLNDLPQSIKRKMLVVHCSEIPEFATARDGSQVRVFGLRKPQEGIEHTVVLPLGDFEEGFTRASRRLQLLCAAPYLRSLTAPDVHSVFAAVSDEHFDAGTVIVRAGEPPKRNTLFIIEEGKAEMHSGSLSTVAPSATLDAGDMFGHIEDGATTIVAKTDLKVISFSAEIFARLPRIGKDILRVLKYRSFIHASLAKSELFRDLSHEQLAVISSCVSEEVRLSRNERLIRQGETTDRSLYIILDGSVRVERTQGDPPISIEFARLGPGQCVGEIALLLGKPRSAHVVANEATTVFRIKKDAFDEVLERYPNIRFALSSLVERRVDDVSRVESLPSMAPRHFSGAFGLHDGPAMVEFK